MQPSATMAMTARAKQLKRQGLPIIGLSAGEPDFDTPQPIRDAAIRAIQDGFTHYTENVGILELREAICKAMSENRGLVFSPDQVVCSNGAKQSVALAVVALSGPGDEVIIPAPYWVSYPEMARLAGAEPVIVPTTADDGYLMSAAALEAAITPSARLLILCTPSNPTGGVYSKDHLAELVDVLVRHPNVFVIADEIYEHIVFDIDFTSIGTFESVRERVVTVNGFSKGFAMTGWRLGYLAAEKEIARAAAKIQGQFTSAPSSISQKAGVAALAMDHVHVQRMVKEFRKRRDYLMDWSSTIPDIVCPKPDGAFYVFPEVSAYLDSTSPSGRNIVSSTDLCMYLLEEHHVALVAGDGFGFPNGLRISYAASMSDLKEATKRISSGLSELRK